MIEVIKTTREIEVDEADLISLKDAAKDSNREMASIGNLLDRGVLPWYELPSPPGLKPSRVQRYTSRKAVAALPKEKTRGITAKAKKGKSI